MKALGKLFGLLFVGLLLIVVTLGFALTQLFDPNDYKDEIRQLARDKANLELQLNGRIGWSLFPWLGIELHDASLASLATPQQPFASLQMLGLSVRVLPLLRREVQMSDVRIEGLQLNLSHDANGRGNWENIGQAAKAQSAAEPGATIAASPASNTAAASPAQALQLDIDSLSIKNSRIDYQDARSGQQFNLQNLQLSSGAISERSAIPFTLSGFFGSNQPLLRARLELGGQARFDRALQRYQLEDARLGGEVSGDPLRGKTLTFDAQGQLLLDLAAQVAEWNNLKLSANQLRALGEIKVHDLDKQTRLGGGLSVARLDLGEFLEGIGVQLPQMADKNALGSFEMSSRLSGGRNSLAFEDLNLKLDDSTFSGSLELPDLQRPALHARLKADQLDLDRYLAPQSAPNAAASARQKEVKASIASAGKSGSTALPAAPDSNAWSDQPLLPLESLRKLDLQLALSIGQLQLQQLPLENLNLKLSSRDGLLNLQELRSDLHGGTLSSTLQLDARSDTPLLQTELKTRNLPLEKLLKSEDKKAPIRGNLDLDANLNSSGNSEKALIDSLAGNVSFDLLKGVLPDANLEQQLCQGIATLNRKTLTSPPTSADTPFDALRGTLQISNGVASNNDLKVRMPGLGVNGRGSIDLRVLGMDYNLGIVIEGDQRSMPDPACQVNKRYIGIEWPIQCRGPLELGARACRLDKAGMSRVATQVAGAKLNEKIEEKLGDKVSPELKDALKGLFNR